jgi:uncharacterized protein (DUF305 family)
MNSVHLRTHFVLTSSLMAVLALPLTVLADQPGRGLTADFEVNFLKMIIDHHYSALRITELAAGTDVHRNPQILPNEGTAPTPGMAATPAKAGLAEIKSIARRNNRMQREEILMAQEMLRHWYGVSYAPQLDNEGQMMIRTLERVQAGPQFDHAFLEVLSRHHYLALAPANNCVVASEIRHEELHRYCRGIIAAQLNDIEDMRELLEKKFNIVDYQPLKGIRGVHSGSDREGSE